MRIGLLACLAVLCLAFAGCSGSGGKSGTSSSTSHSASHSSSSSSSTSASASPSTSSSSSSTSTAPANHAPVGSISVIVNGTSAKFNLTGSDEDQDTLVWDLAFGDGNATNGTSLPAAVSHNYTATGNLTARFTLTDGKNATTYNVTVPLAGAAAPAGQHVTGGWAAGDPVDCGVASLGDTNGVTHQTFDIDPTTLGKAYTITFAGTAPGVWSFTFFDSGGNDIGPDTLLTPPTDGNTDSGTIPASAAQADASSCGGAMVTFDYVGGP